ncbi:MAG: rhomboid family intramembrane serine protease [Thermoplasmatota archaeon]
MAFQEHSRVWERVPSEPPPAPPSSPSSPSSRWGAPPGHWRPLATWWLLGTMGAVFILQYIVESYVNQGGGGIVWPTRIGPVGRDWYTFLFAIGTDWPWRPWTLVTSTFSHASITHILFNGLFLFSFGPSVERLLGRKRFVLLFLAGGALSGVLQAHLESWAVSHSLWHPASLALGASGALMLIFGILMVLTPKSTIFLMLLPIPVPLWIAGIGYAALDVLGVLAPGDSVGHFAHLSGMALGLGYGWWAKEDLRRRGLRVVAAR